MILADLSIRERFLIYAVILLAFGALLYRFVIFRELKRVRATRFQYNSQQDLLGIRAEKIQCRDMLIDEVQQLKMKMAEMEGLLFEKDEVTGFLKALPELISQAGNVLITMKPLNAKNLSSRRVVSQKSKREQQIRGMGAEVSYIRMPVEVAIRGKYNKIIGFFEQLEKYKQLMTVGEVDIATAKSDPAEVDVGFRLNLYVWEY